MLSYQYNHCTAIQIYGWQGKAFEKGREMTRAEYLPYEERVRELLEKIRTTKTGRLLYQALEHTNKKVRILSGDDWDDTAARMLPNTVDNGPNAAIRPFRPAHHNVDFNLKGSEAAWRGQVATDDRSAKKAQIKQQMTNLGLPVSKRDTAPILQGILNRTHLGMTLDPVLTNNRFRLPMAELPQRLNVPANDFDNMVNGLTYMTDAVYYSLCFLLYDYMEPGRGTNTQVRLANKTTFQHDFRADLADEKKFTRSASETETRLAATVLAHELIHAWRMMAGRKIVAGGWEEEAMTTGIGPFSGWRLTENRFRADFGMKTRYSYASSTHSSELMQTTHNNMNGKTYRGIMF